MLGSLLKYDFRALNKVMLPLQLGILLAGILGTVCTTVAIRSISSSLDSSCYSSSSPFLIFEGMVETLSILVAVTLFSIVFVSSFVTLILIARHIYKNFYSSEGYLTFTLPVSVDQHLLSKTISGFIWLFINALIILFSVAILLLFGFSTEGLINVEIVNELSKAFRDILSSSSGAITIVEIIVVAFLSSIMSILQIMFSIIIGGAAARTHKLLAAIGIFLLTNMVISLISSVIGFFIIMFVSMTFTGYNYGSATWFPGTQSTLLATGIVTLIGIVVFYLISRISLKKSLNLD